MIITTNKSFGRWAKIMSDEERGLILNEGSVESGE